MLIPNAALDALLTHGVSVRPTSPEELTLEDSLTREAVTAADRWNQ